MEAIDLKENDRFIDQYVSLRNSYVDLLLTSPVENAGTREWLKSGDIEIRGLVCDSVLEGVVILYIKREGEIAFFASHTNRGIGSRLIEVIEDVARKRKLEKIWAWVLADNLIAQRVFEKSGFTKEGMSGREDRGVIRQGIKYTKILTKR